MLLNVLRRIAGPRRPGGPVEAAALIEQGLAAQARGDDRAAEALYRSLLERAPGNADAAHLLGTLLHRQGRADEAVAMFRRAAGNGGAGPELQLHLGNALQELGEFDEAEAAFEAALALSPEFLPAHLALGLFLKRRGRLGEALATLDHALSLRPDSPEAWHSHGNVLRDIGDEARATESFDRALALNPDLLETRFCRALSLLASGRLEEGWKEHEVRLQLPRLASNLRSFPYPRWRGEPLRGRTLLVWSEQGIGDEIMCANMIPDLIEGGARCVLEVSAKLVPVFARSFPEAIVVPRTQPAHAATSAGVDFQIPLTSLALHLRPSLDRFPARPGFLRAPPDRLAAWRDRLAGFGPGLKVGICWRSTDLSGERALACSRLDQWDALLVTPGVQWFSLQYDECEPELAAARRRTGVSITRFDLDYFNDLDEVSALTKALDLVISAPTAVSVHAAALGVPTWQLAFGADWQMHGTEHVPWFPSLRRHPRRWDETWADVLARVEAKLRPLAEAGAR